jgi:hypothetical protein
MKKIEISASPHDYLQGQMDRVRYEADGHLELMERYHNGTPSYQMGWDGASQHPRVLDPDFAS